MKITSRIFATLIVLIVTFSLTGCITHRTITVGIPVDKSKVALIKPGITTFSEILEWFGPPDYIIDGTQRMVDEAARIPGDSPYKPIPTRTLTSPEGMVILIYSNATIKTGGGSFGGVTGFVRAERMQLQTEHDLNEIFIYLSKKDRVVMEVAVHNAAK